MREILFRGKRGEEPIKIMPYAPDGWVYGDLITCDDDSYIFPHDISGEMYIDRPYKFRANDVEARVMLAKINPQTVGQYTGLCDKSGTKIFEGDIIKLTRTNMYAPAASFHNQDLISLHTIYWNDEKHCFYQNYIDIEEKRAIGAGMLCFEDERAKENIIEVIGNIFDNPELLGKEEE